MKKLLFFLVMFLGLANCLQAEEINFDTHPRAKIVRIDVTDNNGWILQSSYNATENDLTVEYPNWTSTYPYDRFKYSGEVNGWAYTPDGTNYFFYDPWFDQYLNTSWKPNTRIIVEMPTYSPSDAWLQRGPAGKKLTSYSMDYKNGKSYRIYTDSDSNAVIKYEMITQVGGVDLYNNVYFDRFKNNH